MNHTLFIAMPVAAAAIMWSSLAYADPCEAPMPRDGAAFNGQVRYVGDGDSLCVGRSSDPATWIEVRLADFYAPELSEAGGEAAKHALADLTFGQTVSCVAGRRSYDRVIAQCTLKGRPLGELLRRQGQGEGGRGYAPR